jgi:hypothetical protein
MRRLLTAAVVAIGFLATASTASAQNLEFRPIDPNALVVQPTEAATNIFTSTARYVSRVVADTLEADGFVRTINNLLGRRVPPTATSQPGFSPLPLPGTYPSANYRSSLTPAMPTSQIFGRSPTVVPIPKN